MQVQGAVTICNIIIIFLVFLIRYTFNHAGIRMRSLCAAGVYAHKRSTSSVDGSSDRQTTCIAAVAMSSHGMGSEGACSRFCQLSEKTT